MFVKPITMTTSRERSIDSSGKALTKNNMEQKTTELPTKSARRKHMIKPLTLGPRRDNLPERNRINKPFPRSKSYPSYRGAVKWIRDNKETIDTFVEILQCHPKLLQNSVLDKFLSFIHTCTIQINSNAFRNLTEAKRQSEPGMETIPSITITQAFNNTDETQITKLHVFGKQNFEQENGPCSDLISGLSEFFIVHCHKNEEHVAVHEDITENDACLFLISSPCFENIEFLTLFQQIRHTNIPSMFLRCHSLNVSDIKRSRSTCSAHTIGRISPISKPLPPISRTPNLLAIDFHLALENQASFLLERCRHAIIYSHEDALKCVQQICNELNVDIHRKDRLDTEMESLSIDDTHTDIDNVSEICSETGHSFTYNDSDNDTLGASLIVMEHMTNYNKDQISDRAGFRTLGTPFQPFNTSKNTLGLPTISAERTPPLSPVFKKRQKLNSIERCQTPPPPEPKETKMERSFTFDSTTEDTTYLLFPINKGQVCTQIVNWPQDVQNLPNDDCMSEDSSFTGFQDIDFTAPLWSLDDDSQ